MVHVILDEAFVGVMISNVPVGVLELHTRSTLMACVEISGRVMYGAMDHLASSP